jgi:hypothetical protein
MLLSRRRLRYDGQRYKSWPQFEWWAPVFQCRQFYLGPILFSASTTSSASRRQLSFLNMIPLLASYVAGLGSLNIFHEPLDRSNSHSRPATQGGARVAPERLALSTSSEIPTAFAPANQLFIFLCMGRTQASTWLVALPEAAAISVSSCFK